MAYQTGIILVHGSIGNIRNYRLTGSTHITTALKGGPTKTQVDTLPSMELTRQNNSEWKGVCIGVRELRYGVETELHPLTDALLSARLCAMVKKVQLRDFEGVRGQRTIDFSSSHTTVSSLVLNPNKPLKKVTNVELQATHVIDRVTAKTIIPAGFVSQMFDFQGGEKAVRITQIIHAISDLSYNSSSGLYELTASEPLPVRYTTYSDWYLKNDEIVSPVNLITEITGDESADEIATMLQIQIIEFGLPSGGNYVATNHFGIGLVDVF